MKISNGDLPITPLVNEHGHPFHASHITFENKPLTSGLSKREAFAMAAMQGLMANSHLADILTSSDIEKDRSASAILISSAVQCADALLKELER